MPEIYPNVLTLVLCALIMAGAQLIYATVGFGAGMFAVALLALVLPDLADAVTILFVLTAVTEVWVLAHAWRSARFSLLLGLLAPMALGMWIGTQWLASADVAGLKRVLGVVVALAGVWFLYSAARSAGTPVDPPAAGVKRSRWKDWLSLPAGFASGVLGGLFGTGGPPVIIFLRGHGLDKGAFRATLLWYFLIMTCVRAVTYVRAGLLTGHEVIAAAWLLPASIGGMLAGMLLHRRLAERHFAIAVSALLVVLGGILLLGAGK